MPSSRLLAAAPALAGALLLSSCAALSEEGAAAGSGEGTVAAALYPLAYAAERVAGDELQVENLTAPGGEPHELELGVQETALVADALLVAHVESLQPAVDEAVAEVATGEVLDAAAVVDLTEFADESEHDEDADAGEHGDEGEHRDEAGHDDHAEEGHEGHGHGELDPHFWHDPLRMAELGDAIAERLAALVPEQADTFRSNAAALRTDLEQLDEELSSGLADCATYTVVTNHDAFGYLEKYGLHLESIAGISPDADPTPAALARLQELIEDEGVTTVFSESLVSPKTAQTLAEDAGVGTGVLDTIEGLTEETADEDYLSLMRANLSALQEANGC